MARWAAAFLPASVLLAGCVAWFALRAVHGIHFLSFADESGHLLGARAIHAGDRLYRDYIDAHGPLSFMVAHAYGKLFGWREPLAARWAVVAIVGASVIALGASTLFRSPVERLWAVALFLGLLAAPWLVQALDMVNYHVLGGAEAVVALALFVVPACFGAASGGWRAAVAGFSLAMMCGTAYSLAPSAAVFALAAVAGLATRRVWRPLLSLGAGFLLGCLVLSFWLLAFGDVLGYVVFHFIDNQVNYARYSAFGWRVVWRSLLPDFAPDGLVQTGATLAAVSAVCVLIALVWREMGGRALRVAAVLLVFAGLLLLNFRGAAGFQDGSFVVASMGLLSLVLPLAARAVWPAMSGLRAGAVTVCLAMMLGAYEWVDRHAVTSPFAATRAQFSAWPKTYLRVDTSTAAYVRLHQVLRPGERLLVLVYNPDYFLPVSLLPVRKYHGYLPWEADYARHPWFGLQRDLCADLAAHEPAAVIYDGVPVWGRYDPADYMPCVPRLLARDYVADAIPDLYVRRDRAGTAGASPDISKVE